MVSASLNLLFPSQAHLQQWNHLHQTRLQSVVPLCGERGCCEPRVELLTPIRKNTKPRLVRLNDKLLLLKCFLIETIHDQLKNISQIEHSRHRSPANFLVNVVAGLLA